MLNYVTLTNGVRMPNPGFGTWQTPAGEPARSAVRNAIEAGWRHIDTAAVYGNEVDVGRGIAESGVAREELFVTSKVWNTERGFDRTMAAFEKTLSDLGLDYLDLYLIHWPASSSQFENWAELNRSTWEALETLLADGRVRAIGVSNFLPHHLEALGDVKVLPMVNQIEFHPGFMQKETVEYCRERGIVVEAWSPLGTGRILQNETIVEAAARLGKSPAQFAIRWCMQMGVVPLPKSVTPARIRENLDVFDFEISEEDVARVAALPEFGGSGLHPDRVDF